MGKPSPAPFYHQTHKGNQRKAKELIVLVASLTANDPGFGSIKFNKALCHADFNFFFKTGRPITGMEYRKNRLGPTLRALLPLVEELDQERRVNMKEPRELYDERRIIPLDEPDVSTFSSDELLTVMRAIERVKYLSGNEVSDLSHEFPGWVHAQIGETIPYESVFWVDRDLTEDEISYGRQLDEADAAAR